MDKKRMTIIGAIVGLILFGYLIYESNLFFKSGTERLIANKVVTQ